jgi:hypothetical protein
LAKNSSSFSSDSSSTWNLFFIEAATKRVLLSHTFPQLQWQNQQQPLLSSSGSVVFINLILSHTISNQRQQLLSTSCHCEQQKSSS